VFTSVARLERGMDERERSLQSVQSMNETSEEFHRASGEPSI
jgi:hypothetical protein